MATHKQFFLSYQELEENMAIFKQSPSQDGTVSYLCRRPSHAEREVMTSLLISKEEGVHGDNWKQRGSRHTETGEAHPEMQVAVMNSKAIDVIANGDNRWMLAGDQIFVDFDLSVENLPVGTQISLGEVVLEVSPEPHNGCKKFTQRFGIDAVKFVNSAEGKSLRLRGIHTKVIRGGVVRLKDQVRKLEEAI